MKNFIYKYTEKLAKQRAEWIDDTCIKAIPKWKSNLLIKYKSRLLAKLLNTNFEIISETLIANFGTKVIIKLNGKIIGEREFKY